MAANQNISFLGVSRMRAVEQASYFSMSHHGAVHRRPPFGFGAFGGGFLGGPSAEYFWRPASEPPQTSVIN